MDFNAGVDLSQTYRKASTSRSTDVSSSETGEVKESALRYVGQIETYLTSEGVETKSSVWGREKGSGGSIKRSRRKSLLF